jgi:hypothetical protein
MARAAAAGFIFLTNQWYLNYKNSFSSIFMQDSSYKSRENGAVDSSSPAEKISFKYIAHMA